VALRYGGGSQIRVDVALWLLQQSWSSRVPGMTISPEKERRSDGAATGPGGLPDSFRVRIRERPAAGAAPSRAHVHRQGLAIAGGISVSAFETRRVLRPNWQPVCSGSSAHAVLADKRSSLAHVAIACGYYDQAHFTREWYALVRMFTKHMDRPRAPIFTRLRARC